MCSWKFKSNCFAFWLLNNIQCECLPKPFAYFITTVKFKILNDWVILFNLFVFVFVYLSSSIKPSSVISINISSFSFDKPKFPNGVCKFWASRNFAGGQPRMAWRQIGTFVKLCILSLRSSINWKKVIQKC